MRRIFIEYRPCPIFEKKFEKFWSGASCGLWNRLWNRSVTTLETAKKRCDAAASGLGNVKKRCIRPQILFS